jgi:hypothetical protein
MPPVKTSKGGGIVGKNIEEKEIDINDKPAKKKKLTDTTKKKKTK